MKKIIFCILLTTVAQMSVAQDWMKMHRTDDNGLDCTIPIKIQQGMQTDMSNIEGLITTDIPKGDGTTFSFPFYLDELDSINIAPSLADSEKGHNKYRPFVMNIFTEDMQYIEDRDVWMNCLITIDGKGEYSDFCGTGLIRGRGNSSWDWYDKKPYKFKLYSKSKLLGLEKAKNWNLLANYRDVTDMMNTFAFETARSMGMPFTNHSRYVEVFLNHEYIGLYQLTEKIEIKANRIDMDETTSLLMSFDQDDGPELAPEDGDNFWSQVFKLPMCIKSPEGYTQEQIDSIKAEFAILEKAIKTRDIAKVSELMDIPSFISLLQIHEFLYNVEIDAPRSIYVHKAKDGKYTFGPVWDWDAGYDFEWSNMTTGHTFFSDYRELIYGTDPVNNTGAAYRINKFWLTLFENATFVQQYKEAWQRHTAAVVEQNWAETMKYADALKKEGAYDRDIERWPMTEDSWWNTKTFYPATELKKMEEWIRNRKSYLDGVIAGYPDGNDEIVPLDINVVKTIKKTQAVAFYSGYNQSGSIDITQSDITSALGGTPTSLVPLNSNGEEGNNTAAKTYGAWFDEDGDTNSWGSGHVYIESNNLYSWNYGCHPQNCKAGDKHIVTMQYRRGNNAVNVEVTFNVN